MNIDFYSNSRPKKMNVATTHAHEDQNFSSGDESDEASASGSRISWSDFSDMEEGMRIKWWWSPI